MCGGTVLTGSSFFSSAFGGGSGGDDALSVGLICVIGGMAASEGGIAMALGPGLGCLVLGFRGLVFFLCLAFFGSSGDTGIVASSDKIETSFDVFFSFSTLVLEKMKTGVGNWIAPVRGVRIAGDP